MRAEAAAEQAADDLGGKAVEDVGEELGEMLARGLPRWRDIEAEVGHEALVGEALQHDAED